MTAGIAQIIEMDQERDRKTCLNLDLKVAGANRELAQWLLDHPKYTAPMVATWLGCGVTRIKDLRRWAAAGFTNEAHPTKARSERVDGRRAADAPLKTNDNSDFDMADHDEDGVVIDDELAAPEVVEDNFLYAIARINEHSRAFKKIFVAVQ